jgi:cysteine-rich repeat protein
VQSTEGCDDGNRKNDDGCTGGYPHFSGCVVETGWTCSGEPSRCVAGPNATKCTMDKTGKFTCVRVKP